MSLSISANRHSQSPPSFFQGRVLAVILLAHLLAMSVFVLLPTTQLAPTPPKQVVTVRLIPLAPPPVLASVVSKEEALSQNSQPSNQVAQSAHSLPSAAIPPNIETSKKNGQPSEKKASTPLASPDDLKPTVNELPATSSSALTTGFNAQRGSTDAHQESSGGASTTTGASSTSGIASSGNVKGGSGPTTPPRFGVAYLNNPAPEYPGMARRLKQQGTVLLAVLVSEAGHPSEVQIKKSSGANTLDNAASKAVKRWRFIPAKRDGATIAAWVQVPIVFNLED